MFDPAFTGTKHSSACQSSIKIHYKEHPHIDEIKLTGEVHFPNAIICTKEQSESLMSPAKASEMEIKRLSKVPEMIFGKANNSSGANSKNSASSSQNFVPPSLCDFIVDFGSVRHEQEKIIFLDDIKPGEQEIFFKWGYTNLDHAGDYIRNTLNEYSLESNPEPDMNRIFDVCPTFGFVKPFERQRCGVTFKAFTGVEAKTNLLLNIKGGPKYILPITGRADEIDYQLESRDVDFGTIQYDQASIRSLNLKNTGSVSFKFHSDPNAKILPGEPIIQPNSGELEAGENIDLQIIYLPGIPEEIEKEVTLQIGDHFPEFIKVTGVSTFSRIMLDLPRDIHDRNWLKYVEKINYVSIIF